jgi:hypothetical protein
LRVCFIFKYFTYKHSLTQIKWWTNQRLTAWKKRNRLIILFHDTMDCKITIVIYFIIHDDTQIISARADISARVDYKYSSD